MTPRQERFVAEYAIDQNATQAAIRAGYSQRRAAVTASELLRQPEIAEAVAVTNRKVLTRIEITAADIAERAWAIAQEDKPDRVAALNLLAKRHTEFSEKRELSGPNGGPIPVTVLEVLATLAPEQLAALAEEAE